MAVLFVVGLMNLTWMAVIAAIFLAEKTWRHGVALTKVVGVAVVLLGLAVVVRPSLVGVLSTVSGSHGGMCVTDRRERSRRSSAANGRRREGR